MELLDTHLMMSYCVDTVWMGIKYGIGVIIGFALYLAYKFVVSPWRSARHYSQFLNLRLVNYNFTDQGINLLKMMRSYILKNHNEKRDASLYFIRTQEYLELTSVVAVKEFENKIPEYFDRRHNIANCELSKIGPDSFLTMPSNDFFKHRKYIFSRVFGVTFFIDHVPIIVDGVARVLDSIKRDEFVDFYEHAQTLSLHIMCRILFGDDFIEKINIAKFKNKQGYMDYRHFFEIFPKVCKDIQDERHMLKTYIFEYPAKHAFIEPYATNLYNVSECWRVLQDFVNNSKDQISVYKRLANSGEVPPQQVFNDGVGLLFEAFTTLPNAIGSILYLTQKHQEGSQRLTQEVKSLSINFSKINSPDEVKVKVDSCDYLNYVIKECLRIDPPRVITHPYECVDNTSICGINVLKGSQVIINILSLHGDPENWKNPDEFNPERFNPINGDYSTKSKLKAIG